MVKLVNKFDFLIARVRQATQRSWATSVIFVLGLLSSVFMVWVYSEATYHVSSHLPLVVEIGQLSLKLSESHLRLNEYLNGEESVDAMVVKEKLLETCLFSDSIRNKVEFCNGEAQCPIYGRFCPEMRKANQMVSEFVVAGCDIADSEGGSISDSLHNYHFDSLYLNLLSRTEDMHEILISDLFHRKARLGRLVVVVIGCWLGLLALVYFVTRSKEGHRLRIVEALRTAEERVRLFITAADDMIYFQRCDGSISDANAAVAAVSGFTGKQLENNPGLWLEALHPDDRPRVENLLRQPPYKRSKLELQYRLKTRGGAWLWIHSKRAVVEDETGQFIGYNCIDRDITEEKTNAERLAATTVELQERIKEQQCLYGVCQVVRDVSIPLDEALFQILELVEKAWRYPEITRARIVINNQTFDLTEFKSTQWRLSEDILVGGEKVGTLEVYYLEERPYADQGPFVKEELLLIDSIAAKIGANLTRRKSETELTRNFEFLHSVIDSLPYPFYVLDANDFTVKMANAVSGADLSSGRVTCHQLTHGRTEPCSSKSHPCPVKEVRSTGKPCVVQHIHVDQDGNDRYHEVHCYPIFDKSGEVTQVIEYLLDITERRLTENKLGELAAFPANNPNVVMSLNIDGDVLYMNAAAATALRQLGVNPKNADQCLPPDIKHVMARCARSDSGITNVVNEFRNRTWTWSFHPVVGRNIVHCYATDITELIKQEKEVRLLSAAVNQSSTMVCITDTNGIVEYVNPYFTDVTGYGLLDILGKPVSVLKSGEHEHGFYEDMWKTIQSGRSWTANVRNRRRDGELYWERKTITPIHNDDGEIVSFLSVGNDITAELATQRKLIEADKLSAIGTLAAGVAHEFKNYLGGIIGNASYASEMLQGKDGLKTVEEILPRIIDMGEKANEVAMSLLTFSKSRPEDRQPEDLTKLIKKAARLVEKELRVESIELVTHFDEVPQVEVSASKIQQLLLNLLINAQHAIKSHGVITIALFNRDRQVEIRVADTGVGIPCENLERVFDPFFSTKGVWGKDEVTGTGIGLSICRNIAREHGGELRVESIVGIGTTFTLTLPKTPDDAENKLCDRYYRDTTDVLVFSLDKSIIASYHERACQLDARLLAADDIGYLPDDLAAVAQMVICDARFVGKLELYRVVELCREQNVPYVMVNCAASEYELADLHDHSLANFKELPDFEKIASLIVPRPKASVQRHLK